MAPTSPEREISENAIDGSSDDFTKDLPLEAEYYRTSTDRDEFVRPIAEAADNEIDNGDDGIDLDDPNAWSQPSCTYHIDIQLYYESIDQLSIKLDGLTVKSNAKSNLTLAKFLQQAEVNIFEKIKGRNLTNEIINDAIDYLRQTFVRTYGYEDYCGVSTNVVTYFTKKNADDNPKDVIEKTTNVPVDGVESSQIETENSETEMSDIETTTSEEETTTEYRSRVLKRPQLSKIVQETINFYKALHHWNFPPQS